MALYPTTSAERIAQTTCSLFPWMLPMERLAYNGKLIAAFKILLLRLDRSCGGDETCVAIVIYGGSGDITLTTSNLVSATNALAGISPATSFATSFATSSATSSKNMTNSMTNSMTSSTTNSMTNSMTSFTTSSTTSSMTASLTASLMHQLQSPHVPTTSNTVVSCTQRLTRSVAGSLLHTAPLCTFQAANPGLGEENACICGNFTLQLPIHVSGTRTWAVPTCDYTSIPASATTMMAARTSTWTENCQACSAIGYADKLCKSVYCAATATNITWITVTVN